MRIARSQNLAKEVLRFAPWLSAAMLLLFPSTPFLAEQGVRIDPHEIVTLLPKDAIPAIRDAAPLLTPADAVQEVRDSDQVLGVVVGGESRAYPIPFLSWHEIVNDTVGDVPIAVTWCPLCFTGIVYARQIAGQTFTFGVSGKLWSNGLIMYDQQTDSLWSHVAGQAIIGPMQGTILQILPATQTDWGIWKRLHPKTLVLDPSRSSHRRDYNVDPYEGYYVSEDTGVMAIRRQDPRLPSKALVVGLRLDGEVKAYPFARFSQQPVVNDTVANIPVVVAFHERTATGLVFNRRVGSRVLTFVPATSGIGELLRMRDEQTGSLWSGFVGEAMEGALKGKRLKQVPTTYAFWFAWKDYYPNTTVYGKERLQR
jgi:Protein of unknown function (DUF3179)